MHKGSVYSLVKHVYSSELFYFFTQIQDEQWEKAWFVNVPMKRLPIGYWNDSRNQRAFLESLAKKLNIKRAEDWKNVSTRQIYASGGLVFLLLMKIRIQASKCARFSTASSNCEFSW